MQAMQPDPKDRVPSAEAFIKGLRDYLSGAGRRRESEALVAEAKVFAIGLGEMLEPRAAHIRRSAVAERMARALELWPENRVAQELKAANLAGPPCDRNQRERFATRGNAPRRTAIARRSRTGINHPVPSVGSSAPSRAGAT